MDFLKGMSMELKDCNLCAERKFAQQPVPGVGNVQLAQVCLLGRNPGQNEDKDKEPFVGRAGKKLNTGLALAGLVRNTCYITNLSKCYTGPGDPVPSQECRTTCANMWLNDELRSLTSLKLIVTLGNEALWYFNTLGRVGMLHGTHWIETAPWDAARKIEIFCSYHPSAALRSSKMNEHFVNDMERLGNLLKELGLTDGQAN